MFKVYQSEDETGHKLISLIHVTYLNLKAIYKSFEKLQEEQNKLLPLVWRMKFGATLAANKLSRVRLKLGNNDKITIAVTITKYIVVL